MAPGDPRARTSTGRVTVDARRAEKTITVTLRKADEAPITRTIALPEEVMRAESSAVILAGNVARDEARDVLRGLQKRPAAPAAPRPAESSPR